MIKKWRPVVGNNLPSDVLVDAEDLELVKSYNRWQYSKRGDIVSNYQITKDGKKTFKTYKLHRVIMGVTNSKIEVDHINHDRLDNRKKNLRICSHALNGQNLPIKKNNTSGFSGVQWDKARKLWKTRIKLNYKEIHIGRYATIGEAISARLFAEDYYFGQFAPNL